MDLTNITPNERIQKQKPIITFIYIKLRACQNNQWQKLGPRLALGDNPWEWVGGAPGKLGRVLVPGDGYESVSLCEKFRAVHLPVMNFSDVCYG